MNVTTLSIFPLLLVLHFPSFALVYFLVPGPNATISFLYCFPLFLFFFLLVSFPLLCFPSFFFFFISLGSLFTLNFHDFPFSHGCFSPVLLFSPLFHLSSPSPLLSLISLASGCPTSSYSAQCTGRGLIDLLQADFM